MESVDNIVEEIDRSCGDELRLEGPSINQKSDIYSSKRKQSLEARYVYGCIFLITNILAWLFRDYGHKLPQCLLCKLQIVSHKLSTNLEPLFHNISIILEQFILCPY